jgi:hypothetical protein
MKVYQPWIEFGGNDGDIVFRTFTLHQSKENAYLHLDIIWKTYSLNKDIVVLKSGINEIEVIE